MARSAGVVEKRNFIIFLFLFLALVGQGHVANYCKTVEVILGNSYDALI